eukprot:TRINITY_DN16757_c0_g1_i1.p1 TRINITY_DN16757_c0_g1~~TRINITY_DN16757_c0_g1_i1.p1  ORF type:complete len:205 (-),score=27.31 TRINITY_DN16757_c0_g1_i1:56-670(-)
MKLVFAVVTSYSAMLCAKSSGSACRPPDEVFLGVECRLHDVKSTWTDEDKTKIHQQCVAFGEGTRWGDSGSDPLQVAECKLGNELWNTREKFDPWCQCLGGMVALWASTTSGVEMFDASTVCGATAGCYSVTSTSVASTTSTGQATTTSTGQATTTSVQPATTTETKTGASKASTSVIGSTPLIFCVIAAYIAAGGTQVFAHRS